MSVCLSLCLSVVANPFYCYLAIQQSLFFYRCIFVTHMFALPPFNAVDDSAISRVMLGKVIVKLAPHFELRQVTDGQQCLDVVHQLGADIKLIFMDRCDSFPRAILCTSLCAFGDVRLHVHHWHWTLPS